MPETYALHVQRTPNQADSDVTCSRSCDQGKATKKDWKTGTPEQRQSSGAEEKLRAI